MRALAVVHSPPRVLAPVAGKAFAGVAWLAATDRLCGRTAVLRGRRGFSRDAVRCLAATKGKEDEPLT